MGALFSALTADGWPQQARTASLTCGMSRAAKESIASSKRYTEPFTAQPSVRKASPQMTHDREIWDVAFSPDGKYLALAGMDGTVWLSDVAGEKIEGVPMRNQGPVAGLNFSRDGKYLATASYDHTARVWEVPSTKEVARLNHDVSLNGVTFGPTGDRL